MLRLKKIIIPTLLIIFVIFLSSCTNKRSTISSYQDSDNYFLEFEWVNEVGVKFKEKYTLPKNLEIEAEYFLCQEPTESESWKIGFIAKSTIKYAVFFEIFNNEKAEFIKQSNMFSCKRVLKEIQKLYNNYGTFKGLESNPFENIPDEIYIDGNSVLIELGEIKRGYNYSAGTIIKREMNPDVFLFDLAGQIHYDNDNTLVQGKLLNILQEEYPIVFNSVDVKNYATNKDLIVICSSFGPRLVQFNEIGSFVINVRATDIFGKIYTKEVNIIVK